MSRYKSSPMAVQGGQSPMADGFRGYTADRGTSHYSAKLPNERTKAKLEDAPLEPVETLQTGEPTAAELDQIADVSYELDPSGDIIEDTITVPKDEPTPGKAMPSPKPEKTATKTTATKKTPTKKPAAKPKTSQTSRKPKK